MMQDRVSRRQMQEGRFGLGGVPHRANERLQSMHCATASALMPGAQGIAATTNV